MKDHLHRVAGAIRASSAPSRLHLRQGAITAVAADGTVTVTIGGGTVEVAGVAVASSCCPVPGATCWLATDGKDLFVLATLAPAGPAFGSVRQSATQSIPSGSFTALDFTSRTDTASIGVSVGDAGLTCVVPGLYQVTAAVALAANATGERHAQLEVNGSVVLSGASTPAPAGGGLSRLRADGVLALTVGDVVGVSVLQSSGGSLATSIGAGLNMLRMVWTGPTT